MFAVTNFTIGRYFKHVENTLQSGKKKAIVKLLLLLPILIEIKNCF